MKMIKRILFHISLILLLVGCGPGKIESPVEKAPAVEEPEESAVPESAPAVQVKIAEETEGLAVFVAGDVFLLRDGSEQYLEIGEAVYQEDIISTGVDGYCEIQMGDIAVVRIEADSVLELQTLLSGDKGGRVAVDLNNGTVLCKVKKLLDENSFQVKTNTVVCGVRGTQFRVSADSEAVDTVLAVKEGAVAVTPRTLDRVSELATEEDALQALADKIEESALVVGAAQEITVKADAFEELDELSDIVEAVVKKVEEKKKAEAVLEQKGTDVTPETVGVLEEELALELEKLMVSLEDSPEAIAPDHLDIQDISDESQEILEPTDAMEIITLPIAARSVTDADSAEAAPALYNIHLDVSPAKAVIRQNGIVLGRGSFARLYPEGTVLQLEVSFEGYESRSVEMIVGESTSGEYKIDLEKTGEPGAVVPAVEPVVAVSPAVEKTPVNIPVEVRVEPADATLRIDGKTVSGGSWSGEPAEGSVLKVNASRRGYEAVSRDLRVAAETGSFLIRLEPDPLRKAVLWNFRTCRYCHGERKSVPGCRQTGEHSRLRQKWQSPLEAKYGELAQCQFFSCCLSGTRLLLGWFRTGHPERIGWICGEQNGSDGGTLSYLWPKSHTTG